MYAAQQPARLHVLPDHTRSRTGEEVFTQVTDRLRADSCVSFVLICEGWFDYSPELDVAVRLLSIAARGRSVDHGRLIGEHHNRVMTPESIVAGQQTVTNCRELLKRSGVPFEFLAHVDGQTDITVSFSSVEDRSELSQLAEAVADEVRCLTL